MARCTICYTMIDRPEDQTQCPDCRSDYHQTCWTEVGGCGTYGCARAAKAQKPPPPALVGAGWGDSKICPACARPIGSSLLVCACGARFPWADPMTDVEYRGWLADEDAR